MKQQFEYRCHSVTYFMADPGKPPNPKQNWGGVAPYWNYSISRNGQFISSGSSGGNEQEFVRFLKFLICIYSGVPVWGLSPTGGWSLYEPQHKRWTDRKPKKPGDYRLHILPEDSDYQG